MVSLWGKYDQTMMDTALLWAKHGTCPRLSVGAVFAREERILVQGYNGAPKGMPHCDHECDCKELVIADWTSARRQRNEEEALRARTGHYLMCNSQKPCDRAVHAEQNAIAWAARIGVPLQGSTLYSTHQPCLTCARLVISAGVVRVVYQNPYRLEDGLNLLKAASIQVKHLEFEINYNTVPMLRFS